MAGPFDFTGQNIEDTYQRLVQVSGSGFCDGTGSAISIGGSQNLQQVTDQGSTTTNTVTIGSLKLQNTALKSTADSDVFITLNQSGLFFDANNGDKFFFNQNQTDADFAISGYEEENLFYVDASTDKIGIGTNSPGHKLSVNGNVSASRLVAGQVAGFIYEEGGANSQDGALFWDRANKRFIADENFKLSNTHLQARTNQITLQASVAGLTLSGSMNLKGDITASGVIRAFSFVNDSDTTKGLNLRGAGTEITGALDVTQDITAINITASGDISASGDIYATNYFSNGRTVVGNLASGPGSTPGEVNVFGNTGQRWLALGTTIELGLPAAPRPITASGDISASGTITADSFIGIVDGGTF